MPRFRRMDLSSLSLLVAAAVAAAAVVVVAPTTTAAFGCGMTMKVVGGPRRAGRGLVGSSVAHQMAQTIGLPVVATSASTKKNKRNKNKGSQQQPPIIEWSDQTKSFFWGNSNSNSNTTNSSSDKNIQRIENKENFPLFLLSDVLSPASLDRALALLSDIQYEELEQHERVVRDSRDGKNRQEEVRSIRRSLVSQLDARQDENNKLLALLLSSLPADLHDNDSKFHPYEDGSVVSYRYDQHDFYDEHHDSYDADQPLRTKQRAYTVLFYLQMPPSSPPSSSSSSNTTSNGATEFTRLTPIDIKKHDDDTQQENGLLVTPQAGHALVWPNFDATGRPHPDSVHRALPVFLSQQQQQQQQQNISGKNNDTMMDSDNRSNIGKVVVNLWFEGKLAW
jgi:hypothetical protein